MLYLVLLLALLCLTVKGYYGKKLSCHVRHTQDTYLFNLIRLLMCSLIGAILVFIEGSGGFLYVEWRMLAICALSGISNAAFLVFWMLAIRKNTMVSVDVGLTLGSLIPSVLCTVLFAEAFSFAKMIGFALILVATVILAWRTESEKGTSLSGIILLIAAAVGDGLSGFAQQLYKHCYTDAGACVGDTVYPKTVFHFYTYVFAALVLAVVLAVYRAADLRTNKDSARARLTVSPSALIYISIMAACLFAANYFQTVATGDYALSSQVMYPIIKGGCLITVNITAMLFFGERITWRSVLGSLVALLGIVVMSIL
jgi:drug/metabolite transporter (DMT)-like permease